MENKKEYSNDDITVIWISEICIHSGNCVRELGKVFNLTTRPWIKMYSASTEEIIKTVNNCPSGALTYKWKNDMLEQAKVAETKVKFQVISGGPLMVEGPCAIVDKDGNEIIKEGKVFLCRCGGSKNKPYCDGSHKTVEFDK